VAIFEAAIMAAGFWLARMLAFWPLCIESAAAMLPTTLQKSNLCLEEAPELIHISAFERSASLQQFSIDSQGLGVAEFIQQLKQLHLCLHACDLFWLCQEAAANGAT